MSLDDHYPTETDFLIRDDPLHLGDVVRLPNGAFVAFCDGCPWVQSEARWDEIDAALAAALHECLS